MMYLVNGDGFLRVCSLSLLLLVVSFLSSETAQAQDVKSGLISLLHDDKHRTKVNFLRERYTQQIAEQLGAPVSTAFCPTKRCFSDLYEGAADLLLFVNSSEIDDQRVTAIGEFTVDRNTLMVYLRKGEEDRVKTFRDLEGMTVGTILGLSYGNAFKSNQKIIKYEVGQSSQLSKMLLAGRIDAFVTFRSGGEELEQYPSISRVEVAYRQGGFAIALVSKSSSYYQELTNILPSLFDEWIETGDFEKSCDEIDFKCPASFSNIEKSTSLDNGESINSVAL